MYRPALSRLVVGVVGVLVLPILAALATACGAPEESKPRPLPEDPQTLSPGTYVSEEYEPSLSFRVGDGWATLLQEGSDHLALVDSDGDARGLHFVNAQEVYEPTSTDVPDAVEAPEDLVGWFRQHPLLQTEKPKQVTVGGIEGERFDVVVGEVPQGYYGDCGWDCVDVFRVSEYSTVGLPKGGRYRVIVLEDVKGETVTIGVGSPASDFDEFAPEAQKVIDTVKWSGS
jgi:hypothetical protein